MNSGNNFDVIVIGVGSMGAAACYYLASNGAKVLGLEQFDIPNERSSHTGQSRLIRKAYFEHPNYVPLLEKAYKNWKHLEEISSEQVYHQTGLLYAAPAGHSLLKGVRTSAEQYHITLESFDENQLGSHCPSMKIPAGFQNLFEPEAGFITAEKALRLYAKKAADQGAMIKTNEAVQHWTNVADGIEVITGNEKYFAQKLVICSGPWASQMIPGLQRLLTVTKQVLSWVNVRADAMLHLGQQPCWILAVDDQPGIFYGFPILPADQFEGPTGFKLAHHFPGAATDPNLVNRETTADDTGRLVAIMEDFFPGVYKSIHTVKTCLYTNTPDEDFIIDFLPGYDQKVIIAAGFSGHGFKFASVLGEILADLALQGTTDLPIDFLSARRFTVVNK
jgi:sarcosine oxidase